MKLLSATIVLALLLTSCQRKVETPVQGSLQATAVKVASLSTRTVQGGLDLNGILHADQDVVIKAETQGRVTAVHVRVGDQVAAGQVLAEVDDVIKRATWEANQANLDKLKKDLDRIALLRAQKVANETDLDNVKLAVATAQSQTTIAAKDLENTRIKAPFAGTITETSVTEGTMASVGAPVVHLINLEKTKIVVNVNEKDILQVHPGDTVDVRTEADPSLKVAGKVRAISPQASAAQNFPVEVTVAKQGKLTLLDGMSVTVHFSFGERRVQALPRSALIGSLQQPQVYVVEAGKAVLKSITVGAQYDTDLEVTSGLTPADQVVVSGQNNLQDGVAIQVVP
ncbi:MAG: efflux RND transporter periplasmic adaptor subunit [Spirochaetales bacterium]